MDKRVPCRDLKILVSFLVMLCVPTLVVAEQLTGSTSMLLAQVQKAPAAGMPVKKEAAPAATTAKPKVVGPLPAGISVLKPDGKSEWCIGDQHTVEWKSTLPPTASVKIEAVHPDGKPWVMITQSAPNTGKYQWTISPTRFVFGYGDCKIRISASDGSVAAESEKFVLGKQLVLDDPKSNYTWRKGSYYRIRWFQGCTTTADKLKIDLLDGNKQPLMTLATGEPIRSPNHIGSTYKWTVPSTLSPGTYYIRITTMDNAFSDESSVTIAEPAQ